MQAEDITKSATNVSGFELDETLIASQLTGAINDTAASIDLDAQRAEFAEMRKLFSEGEDEIKGKRSALNETTQERLYQLIERGIKQARVLIKDENETALRQLVEGTEERAGIGASLALQKGARLKQIVALQIGYRATKGKNKGRWIVPARRDERVAHLYAIILQKGWSNEGCVAKIKELGGAAAVIKANPKRVSRVDEGLERRRKETVAADETAPFIEVANITPAQVGEFRLAIVSCHMNGVKFHEIAPVDITVRNRVVADFLKDRYRQLLLADGEMVEAQN